MNEAWRCWKADKKYEIDYDLGGNWDGSEEGREGDVGGSIGEDAGEGNMEGKDEGILNDLNAHNPPVSHNPLVSLNNPVPHNPPVSLTNPLYPSSTNPPPSLYLNSLISTFVKRKAQWYVSDLQKNPKNKKEINKKIGKLTRLYIKEEKERQRVYLNLGGITPDKAIDFYKSSFEYFKKLGNPKIKFPDKNEVKHLKLANERIRNDQNERVKNDQNERIRNDQEQNDSNENILIFKIKKSLLTQRKFREITLLKKEVYSISFLENLTDAFLSSYLFFEADTLGIFPEYFKPGDEIDMKNIYKMCKKVIEGCLCKEGCGEGCREGSSVNLDEKRVGKGIDALVDKIGKGADKHDDKGLGKGIDIPPSNYSLYEIIFKDVLKSIDINLLKKILLLFMDPILVDYLISRNNCTLVYKDMDFENHVGFIPGLAFSPFIFKIYLSLIDFYAFREFIYAGRIMRYMEKVYLICDENESENNFKPKNIDYFYNFEIIRRSSFPNFEFEMAGVECSIVKRGFDRTHNCNNPHNHNFHNCNHNPHNLNHPYNHSLHDPHNPNPPIWNLQNGFYAILSLSSQTLSRFKSRIDQIVLTSQSSTFLKVITKWNSTVLGFINQFREIIPLNFFIPFEKKIQNVVKQGINSKMPIRFPSVIFYAPQEYGGLGMYKTSVSCNEEGNDKCKGEGSNVEGSIKEYNPYSHFLYPNHLPNNHSLYPNLPNNPPNHSLLSYFKPWLYEILDSDQAWSNFKSSNLILKEVGLPRMSTLLQKNKISFYDRSFRLVRLFRKFTSLQYDPLPFTNLRHDGLLYNLDQYKESITSYLGGPSLILKHTLFKATFSKNFSKLFWDDSYLSLKTKTFAQKRGLNQIPNKRFIFWWSPTINRAEVYVGYETLLEPTGVVMHGKLPTLKMSYLGIFKNNLWKKIQESLVYDFIKKIKIINAGGEIVLSHSPPSKKSYQFTIGYPDFLIFFNNLSFWVDIQLRWGDFDRMNPKKYAKVKYVEYTSHYLSKYPSNTNGGILIVFDLCYNLVDYYYEISKDSGGKDSGGLDEGEGLYGKHDEYDDKDKDLNLNDKGDHNVKNIFFNPKVNNPNINKTIINNPTIPSLDLFLSQILQSILKNNLSLHILRERIRSSLDIYSKEIQTVSSPKELFHDSLIVEDRLLFTSNRSLLILDPESGTVFFKGVPPGEGKKPRVLRNFLSEDVFKFAIESKKGNILGRKEMIEVLGGYQVDYPKINLKIIKNEIPWYRIGGLIKGSKVGDKGKEGDGGSKEGDTSYNPLGPNTPITPNISNLYKNWFGISKFTSFCRLVLILKSNLGDLNEILPDKDWIRKEREMKNKIIEKYCEKKVMNPKKLNEIEIRDIVFGIEDNEEGDGEREGGREGKYREERDNEEGVDQTLYTHKQREQTLYTHKQDYDQPSHVHKQKDQDYDLNQIINTLPPSSNNPPIFELPKNLIYLFCSLTHFNSISFCLLVQDLNCISLIFIPQYSTPSRVFSSRFKSFDFEIKGLMINSDDQRIIDELIEKYKIENPIFVIIKNKLKSNREIKISEEEGGCYLPEIWDYSKNKGYFSEEMEYELRLGI